MLRAPMIPPPDGVGYPLSVAPFEFSLSRKLSICLRKTVRTWRAVLSLKRPQCRYQTLKRHSTPRFGKLTFPYRDDVPSHLPQPRRDFPVSLAVPLYLFLPKVAVGLRKTTVALMSVPKTSVDEYGGPQPRQHYVGPSRKLFLV